MAAILALLQRIVCTPDDQGRDGWQVELHGDVAAILALTEERRGAGSALGNKKRPDPVGSGRLLSLVAGT